MKRVAYITGGSKGIGLGIAESMAEKGINLVLTSRNIEELEIVKERIESEYEVECLVFAVDVTDLDAMMKSVETVLSKWGRIDYVIANAGVGHFHSIEDMTTEQWNQTIDINLTGVFNTTKACIPALKNSKGYLITIASLAGTNFFPKGAAYNASKFGLVGFSQAVMLDLREYGVKVTTIMPGSVATYFNNRIPTDADSWKIQPEDIGQMVVDLIEMPARTLPSKIEVRPSMPKSK